MGHVEARASLPVGRGMSDTDDEDSASAGDSGGDEGGGAAPKKKSRKKLLFIAAPVLVIVIAVVVMFGMGIGPFGGGGDAEHDPAGEEEALKEAVAAAPGTHFIDLPEMLVNLQTDGSKTSFIKMAISLELTDKSPVTIERVTAMMPRVIDNFQVYMRELRLDDLNGSAGMFRLKEELLRRVNVAVQPVQVKDILFRELLVQ